MQVCPTHKKVYVTYEIAENALIAAHTRFDYPHGGGPVAVYECNECHYYHLTSQGEMNERLAQHLKEGKIKRQKEADYWLSKMKGKR
jgi:hypothetical protein